MSNYIVARIKQKLLPSLMKSEDLKCILKRSNIDVGEHTFFYGPGKTVVDTSRPALLQIGDYCKITSGVIILTHDYSRSVLRRVYGDIIGEGKKTVIGDNVFLGMNSIVLMGSHIGSNVIVGAGSVVSGDIPDNVVVAGNPARVIRDLDAHYSIMKKRMLIDAEEYYFLFLKKYGRKPSVSEMNPFFPLFLRRSKAELDVNHISLHLGGDDECDVKRGFLSSKPMFDGYDEFVKYIEEKKHVEHNL